MDNYVAMRLLTAARPSIALSTLAPTVSPTRAADNEGMETQSLFARLGGTSGINALVEDIVDLHMENPIIRARFRPYLETPDKLAIVKKHLCAFLEAGSGGTGQYSGRNMRDTHKGMNISAAEYMAAVDDIIVALKKHSIDERTQGDVLAIAYSLKGDIMHL